MKRDLLDVLLTGRPSAPAVLIAFLRQSPREFGGLESQGEVREANKIKTVGNCLGKNGFIDRAAASALSEIGIG